MFVRVNLKVKPLRKACLRRRDKRIFGLMAFGAMVLLMIVSLAHADEPAKKDEKKPELIKIDGSTPVISFGANVVMKIGSGAIKIPAYASSLYFEECNDAASTESASSGVQSLDCANDFTKCYPEGDKKKADDKDKKKKEKAKPFDPYCHLAGAELLIDKVPTVVGRKPEKNYCELKLNVAREGADQIGSFAAGRVLQSVGSGKTDDTTVVVHFNKGDGKTTTEKTALQLRCPLGEGEKSETYDADRLSKILGPRVLILTPPPKESRLELPRKKKAIDAVAIKEEGLDLKDAKSKNGPGSNADEKDSNGVQRL